MNERTSILQIRRLFRPAFGADLVEEAERLREAQPDLPASAVLAGWQGGAMTRLFHHPGGAEAPIALVAGRHTNCDLGAIPGASLRHALVLLWPPAAPGGTPLAEVIDLGTRTGIALPDGRFAARVAGAGAIRFGVGKADAVIVQARAGEPLAVEKALSKLREGVDPTDVTPHSRKSQTRYYDVSGSPDPEESSSSGGSCEAIAVEVSREPTLGSEHVMLTEIVNLGGRLKARVLVRAEDLERGVRLGRYARCRGASVLGRDVRVSRVHAFVLDRGGRRWLFDTASTNGTEVVDVDTGRAIGPVRGERTFALHDRQAPLLAGQVAFLDVGVPAEPC
jgi:hypothetical protein